MQLRIVQGKPPIYDEIVRVIRRPPAGAVFTWGDILYVPKPPRGMVQPIDEWLMEHEHTHSRQQAILGGPEAWWRRYLDDNAFRLQQELAAYRNQYALASRHLSRQARRLLLRQLARDLSSSMYGDIITRAGAVVAIAAYDRPSAA